MDLYDRALAVLSHTWTVDDLVDVVCILLGMASAANLFGDMIRRDRAIRIAADLLGDARLNRRRRPD